VEKLVYLIWKGPGGDADAVRRALLDECAPRLRALGLRGLSVAVDDSDSAVPAPVPWPAEEAPLAAAVSVWLDCYDRRGPCEALLSGVGDAMAGYLVTESLYTDYGGNRFSAPRDWPDGERSPGLLTVTLLEKPERLGTEAWIAHWHGVQSPVSEAIQPRTRYVRNAVVRAVTPEAPPYLGIVEEAWPSAEHVTDPMLFYGAEGSRGRMQQNLERMLESVRAFLDLDRIRNVTMSEYLLAPVGPLTANGSGGRAQGSAPKRSTGA
jgi:hypothetical protein